MGKPLPACFSVAFTMPHGSFKPTRSDMRLFSRRLLVVRLFVLAGVIVLVSRLAWLQIIRHDHYSNLATSNSIRANFLSPVRGRIFDRGGEILAANKAAFSLEVLPRAAGDIDALVLQVRALISLSDEEEAEFRDRLTQVPLDDPGTILLREDLSTREVAVIASQLYRLDGLSISNFLRRVYPDGSHTSAVLGHMGRITPDDWRRIDQKLYARHGFIGKTGLEAQYEDLLHGRPGYSYVEVDAHGRMHKELDRRPAELGMDLHTTISLDLQRSAGEALVGRRGAVVAMEPATGEVLVLYSAPSFDNNKRLNQVMRMALTEDAPKSPLFNRATSGVYPPASTIKPILALHPDLDEVFAPTQELKCTGSMRVGRRNFRDWKRGGHGEVDLRAAIAESCDVYFYRISLLLGVEGLREAMLMFGFGQPTGIDLPAESAGLVPSQAWKIKRYNDVWRPGDSANTGIGQGYVLATPLQMAAATAALANRGVRVRPHLYRGRTTPRARVAAGTGGGLDESVDFSDWGGADGADGADDASSVVGAGAVPERWQARMVQVVDGMKAVVHSEKGTARRVRASFESVGLEIAGKTGTAQVVRLRRGEPEAEEPEELKDHSMFIGFAPYDNPQIAVAVVVENAGNGSAVAAPLGAQLMLQWLQRDAGSEQAAAGGEGDAGSEQAAAGGESDAGSQP